MIPYFKNLKPIHQILLVALLFRVIAAIFSQGYGMHDDHFLIIESSGSWVDGYDYNHWLPWSEGNTGLPEGHSFTYVGLNYVLFALLKGFGIADPKMLMLINRLVHALVSLWVVYFGYRITEKLSDEKLATRVGWILALLWALPILSVRNLVEMTAIPLVMASVWYQLKGNRSTYILYAGIFIGLATSFRYQIGVYALAVAAIYFFTWRFKDWFLYCVGVLLTFSLTQGFVDYLIWGYPFAELQGYITYNLNEGTSYMPNKNYFMYFLVLMGVMLFPLGILTMIGFFKSAKKYFIVFLPTFIFILFHTIYPNRQERFVLSILPLFILLGILGYEQLRSRKIWDKIWRPSWVAFWSLNIPILLMACFVYSKKSRVEAMYSLYEDGIQHEHILLEGSGNGNVSMMPVFYSGDWHYNFKDRTDSLSALKDSNDHFDYIFFFDEQSLNQRIAAYQSIYPQMELHKKSEPSFVDVLLRKINPRNKNEYIEVWKTNDQKP